MSNVNIKIPDWLRQMESILEELNEGVVIVDHQLRVVFGNEALIRMGKYDRGEIEGRTPDVIFPAPDIPYIMRQHTQATATDALELSSTCRAKMAKGVPGDLQRASDSGAGRTGIRPTYCGRHQRTEARRGATPAPARTKGRAEHIAAVRP